MHRRHAARRRDIGRHRTSTAPPRPRSSPATCRGTPQKALDGSLEGSLKFVRFRPPLPKDGAWPAHPARPGHGIPAGRPLRNERRPRHPQAFVIDEPEQREDEPQAQAPRHHRHHLRARDGRGRTDRHAARTAASARALPLGRRSSSARSSRWSPCGRASPSRKLIEDYLRPRARAGLDRAGRRRRRGARGPRHHPARGLGAGAAPPHRAHPDRCRARHQHRRRGRRQARRSTVCKSLYAGRADAQLGLQELKQYDADIMDGRDRMRLAERHLVDWRDGEAHRIIAHAARRITLLTTVAPTRRARHSLRRRPEPPHDARTRNALWRPALDARHHPPCPHGA